MGSHQPVLGRVPGIVLVLRQGRLLRRQERPVTGHIVPRKERTAFQAGQSPSPRSDFAVTSGCRGGVFSFPLTFSPHLYILIPRTSPMWGFSKSWRKRLVAEHIFVQFFCLILNFIVLVICPSGHRSLLDPKGPRSG